jgi:hypothetical protein
MHAVLLPLFPLFSSLALLRMGTKAMLYEFTLFGPILFLTGAISAA